MCNEGRNILELRGFTKKLQKNKKTTIARVLSTFSRQRKNGKFIVFENIDLKLKYGEVLGVKGVNGAGKSVFLKTLVGIYSADGGSQALAERPVSLFEFGQGIETEFLVKDLIDLYFASLGLDFSKENYRVVYDFAELSKEANTRVRDLSKGMIQRIIFSISKLDCGKLILMDELLSGVDADFKTKATNHLCEMKKLGKTLIIASHDESLLEQISDKYLILKGAGVHQLISA